MFPFNCRAGLKNIYRYMRYIGWKKLIYICIQYLTHKNNCFLPLYLSAFTALSWSHKDNNFQNRTLKNTCNLHAIILALTKKVSSRSSKRCSSVKSYIELLRRKLHKNYTYYLRPKAGLLEIQYKHLHLYLLFLLFARISNQEAVGSLSHFQHLIRCFQWILICLCLQKHNCDNKSRRTILLLSRNSTCFHASGHKLISKLSFSYYVIYSYNSCTIEDAFGSILDKAHGNLAG